jgi:two-component system cell cycle response regulator DivK
MNVVNEISLGHDPVHEPEPVIRPRKKHRRILVVEDDHSQAEVLAHRFRKLGFAASTSLSGTEGLQKAHNELPDLIIMDIRMPGMDGLHVAQRLSDDPETCHIPVILLSGMSRPDIIRKSRAAGCEYYVRKPYDPNALLMLAESAMNERDKS